MIFGRYFPLMMALNVYWLSRRHKFSSIPDSAAESSMTSPTHIKLALCFLCQNAYLISSVIGYVCKTSCDEVWQNMSPGDEKSSHYLVGIITMILHDESWTFTNVFSILQWACSQIFLDSFFWMLIHNLWFFLCIAPIVTSIVYFFSTSIAGDMFKVS